MNQYAAISNRISRNAPRMAFHERICGPITHHPGIERPAGVDMRLTKIRVARGGALGERWRNNEADKSGSQYGCREAALLGRLIVASHL